MTAGVGLAGTGTGAGGGGVIWALGGAGGALATGVTTVIYLNLYKCKL